MGRSKFPGKPSKHIHRKRVNVLPPIGEISNVESSSSVTVHSVGKNKQDEDLSDSDGESASTENSINKNVSIRRRLTRKLQTSLRSKNVTKKGLLSKMCTKPSIKTKLNKGTRTTLTRKNVHTYASCRGRVTKETTNLVGKFVLPTRSVHSSRVIKPNKRFISDIDNAVTLKKKVSIVKRHCGKPDDHKSQKFIESGSFNSVSDSDKTTFTHGHRVVLRQARLKLPNEIGLQGPFSTKPNSSGAVTCEVCGAVRFYRFIKQARKFNIYSCESCRKFIAKMIKRQACGNKNNQLTLVCNKVQGNCQVASVRNQQWKINKYGYRARCPACWLKMCLRAFHIPPSLKQGLILMLPKNMQGLDMALSHVQPTSLWQANVETKLVIDQPQETTTIKQRPIRFRNPKAQTVSSLPVSNSDIKRQKIDLKGPRVKHVCRSASIVLGQPIATFPESDKKCDIQEQVNDIKVSEEKTISDKIISDVKLTATNRSDSTSSEPESSYSDRTSKISNSDNVDSTSKREKLYRHSSSIVQQIMEPKIQERKKNLIDPQLGILIDFWDGYDPENVCQNGFCIIGSEQFTMSSVCFLCGSAGKETMYYCSICCEPYHSFCLEQAQTVPVNRGAKYYTWTCPRCTTCNDCNKVDRQKVSCHKCLKTYHPECFNPKWNSDEKPTVCSKCLKCKSCGTSNITNFVGNLPLCITCFKLRKKGNFCPICQHCYDDNECCSKMMECSKCCKWVHAKCEHLTEEQYQILSVLPESVEYMCPSCCRNPSPYWRKAITNEMKLCFNQILRLLSKNKTARNLLKWSPLNNSVASTKGITNVRKLQFTDDYIDFDNNNFNKDLVDINKIYSFEENEKYEASLSKVSNTLSVVDVKNKLISNEYSSIKEFNKEIEESLKLTKSDQLLKIYQSIFQDVFPWYHQSYSEEFSDVLELDPTDETQDVSTTDEKPYIDVPSIPDSRSCGFCKGIGDGLSHFESRLLYCGLNEWVHANCALWSSEVYEEIDGSLQNVQNALNRGRMIRCAHCKQKGASVGCCYKGCHETFHFPCARSANMKFMYDKTVYCASHDLPKKSHLITSNKDFDIDRSVFVEVDQKKRKYSELDKATYMIGSLCVKSLGKIDPVVSDTTEFIIPAGFVCTRIFWSTIEPWKLIPYTITTSIKNYNNNTLIIDRNFTIDHSLNRTAIDKITKEISLWQRDVDKKVSDIDSEDDEEQQNGADILSPELTDAILEELPHDLLDGISVQDIFPKFSYDELIDYKTDLTHMENLSEVYKKAELDEDVEMDLKSKDFKRNKIDSMAKSRPSPKTCSLTLSCKLDSSLSSVIKKRKVVAARENTVIYQLLQVDGNCDDSSSSECGSPTGITSTNPWGTYISEEPVTCDKCQSTYRTQASYKRHLESCEMLCTSESDSEMNTEQDMVTAYLNPNTIVDNQIVDVGEPVVISSYESFQSEIHTSVLNTQSFVSSKSTSEVVNVPSHPDIMIPNSVSHSVEQKSLLQTLPITSATPMNLENSHSEQNFSINQPFINEPSLSIHTNQPQFCVNQPVPLCVSQPITIQQNGIQVNPTSTYSGNQVLSINPSGSLSLNPVQSSESLAINQINHQVPIQQPLEFQQAQSVTIQPVPYNNTFLNVGSQNQFTINGKLITNPVLQTLNVPGAQWVKQISKPTLLAQKTIKTKARSRTLAAKRSSHFEEETIILPAQGSSGQVIVQHLPSTNYIPTFVDPFQQSGQNLQYVATIAPQVNSVSAQSIVQIQPDNNIISIVPGLQQTMYIQQPRVENQLVVNSNGTLGWSSQQSVQPVYYGFETIVQNTVMQSQQFLPTTMPGVLTANSSYSTTTQVFQTSKLEPVLDVSSNSFVIVNPGQLVNSQPVVNSQQIVNSQPINSQPIVTSQQIVNSQPIVNSTQLVNSHPIETSQTVVNSQPIVSSQHILDIQPQCTLNSTKSAEISGTVNNTETFFINTQPSPAVIKTHSDPLQHNLSVKVNTINHSLPQRQDIKTSQPLSLKLPQSQQMNYSQPSQKTVPNTTHSISLPTAPFVSEQRIPTNIVTPIPKPPTSAPSRPMSRVLPMPTNNIKESKNTIFDDEKLFFPEEKKKPIQIQKVHEIKANNNLRPLTKSLSKLDPNKKIELVESKIIRPAYINLLSERKPEPLKTEKMEEVFGPTLPKPIECNLSKSRPPKTLQSIESKSFKSIVSKAFESILSKPFETIIPKAFESIVGNVVEPHDRKPFDLIRSKPFESLEPKSVTPFVSKPSESIITQPIEPILPKSFEPITSKAFEPITSKAFEPIISKAFEPITSKAFEPITSKAFEPITSKAFEPITSKAFEPITSKPIESILLNPLEPSLPRHSEPTAKIVIFKGEKPPPTESSFESKAAVKKEVVEEKAVEISIPEDPKLDTSLKLLFQKQGQDGTYKISTNFTSKQPLQIVPLKPIKSTSSQNRQPMVVEKQIKESEKFVEKRHKFEEMPKTQVSKKENENSSSILYTMETQDGFKCSSSSVSDLWSKLLEAVQTARAAHNMPPLPNNNGSILNSIQILGLKSAGSKYLIEQLPGATKCTKYKSVFNFPPHPSEIDNDLTQDHVHGAIRCAPYEDKNNEPFDMFGWLSSKHRQPEEISLDTLELLPRRVVNLPMAMKFRQLKLTSKYSVGVYRSCIHGRGLFCLRDIEAGEMVIEYAGEVIRSILTDKREKYYNSKGIGCYMFRVDDNFVVDATMRGNAARFINHSCDPNCYSRVVEILGHKHIIIFALRRILSGEELTYDYKFPFEEDKIPCTCGSRKCRKFLN